MARPTAYTMELADKICERLIDGESLRAICSDDDVPSKATVLRWLETNPDFRARYALARKALVRSSEAPPTKPPTSASAVSPWYLTIFPAPIVDIQYIEIYENY